MNWTVIYTLALAVLAPVQPSTDNMTATDGNYFKSFFEGQSEKMKAFFVEQRGKMEQAWNTSVVEAVKMKDSVNSYVEEQHQKISADINNYVENAKENGRRFVDTWSFVSGDDKESRMECPDIDLTVPAIILRNDYACETHTVVSQGYVLNMHRIPRSRTAAVGSEAYSKTILLQHGLFASSADWILNGPEKGLAYVLADAGYDVWMANIRGNRYSREHTWLRTDSKHYWNFSWHDVALHDVPAVIDYINRLKGPDCKITYIGHSMGTTILFAMLALRPEYNDILNAGYALAPVVFMSNVTSPLKSLAPVASNVAYMEMLYGSHEFIPKNSSLSKITTSCKEDSMDSYLCKNVIFYICGHNEGQFNKTLLPVFLAHLGTGTSWKTAVHFSQEIVNQGKFQQFDYGSHHNNRIYGRETPPEYDLSKVTLPIKLFWSENDLLSNKTDVMTLQERLPKSTEVFKIEDPEFNHLDYLWAKDAPKLINDKVLDCLKKDFGRSGPAVYFNFNFHK